MVLRLYVIINCHHNKINSIMSIHNNNNKYANMCMPYDKLI